MTPRVHYDHYVCWLVLKNGATSEDIKICVRPYWPTWLEDQRLFSLMWNRRAVIYNSFKTFDIMLNVWCCWGWLLMRWNRIIWNCWCTTVVDPGYKLKKTFPWWVWARSMVVGGVVWDVFLFARPRPRKGGYWPQLPTVICRRGKIARKCKTLTGLQLLKRFSELPTI
jgi:hypothetical protein